MTTPPRRPISPARIIPAGQPLPVPASPPPAPPAPPTIPPVPPDWWRMASGPSGPPPPVPIDVHVTVTLDQGGLPAVPDPEPGPRWWQRIRIGYNLALIVLSMPLTGPWSWVLASVRDDASLPGAWVMAVIPLVILAFADNVYRCAAAGAHPDLWMPKIRAAAARLLLWAAVIATALTLPIATLVTATTGVQP